jgi:hypothetical protein
LTFVGFLGLAFERCEGEDEDFEVDAEGFEDDFGDEADLLEDDFEDVCNDFKPD